MTGGAGQRDPIRIGRVGRPHGVRGGFYVDGAIDPDALRSNLAIVIAGAAYTVASRAGADSHPILTLMGLDERDRAAALRGQVITAERDALTPLATGEWYASDLEGMHVVSVDGATLGIVGKLSNTPSVDVLEIVGEDGAELMVPMVGDAIASIDAVARTVTVDTRFLGLGESRDLG